MHEKDFDPKPSGSSDRFGCCLSSAITFECPEDTDRKPIQKKLLGEKM